MAEERTTDETKSHIIEGKLRNKKGNFFWILGLDMFTYKNYPKIYHIARRRVERKKLRKMGKSTDTKDTDDDGDYGDEGILVID